MPFRVVLCLLAAVAASPAGAQGNANATVCAADDDSAFSPEQRIAACNALIKAARNAPKEVADALVNRGQAAWYADKMKQAFADLDRAIALDPNNARAFRERSNAYRSIGKLDRALADASEAVRLDPRDAKAFDNRGDVFVDKSQYDRAIQDYDEALRLDPKLSLAFRDRGAAYYFKDYERAIKDYDEAIKLDPRSDRAYSNRSAAYRSLAATGKRSPMRARRSSLNHLSRPISTIAACPTRRRATTTAPSSTITRRLQFPTSEFSHQSRQRIPSQG